MAFNVTYSFNNGAVTGTATSITALRTAIYNYAHSGNVSSSSGGDYSHLTQCTLSGIADGKLKTGNQQGTTTGTNFGLFSFCRNLISLNLSSLNTSSVTDMGRMFEGCESLTSLDLSNLNTSNVINMEYMFDNCSSLTSLDLSNFNTNNVIAMNTMFGYCSSLTTLDLYNFNTSNVISMSNMFEGCSTLTSIKVKKSLWDTSKVTSSSSMFSGCTHLPNYNSSSVDISKAIDKSLGGYLDVESNVLVDLFTEYDNFPSKIFLSNNYIKVTRKVGKYGI